MAGGLPAVELFPADEYAEAVTQVLSEDPSALQYSPTWEPLREQIVDLMRRRGVACDSSQIVLTTGAQQGIDLLSQLFLEPGGQAAVETITYTGVRQAMAPMSPELLQIASDPTRGIDVEELEGSLEEGQRPRLLYIMSDAHNPLGVSLPQASRKRLVELSSRYGFPIIEDDPYGLLSYDEDLEPPLVASGSEHVLYVGSFSKILAPGLRLGWIVAPSVLEPRLAMLKEAADLECSSLTQRAVSHLLSHWDLDAHLDLLRRTYGERRQALLSALDHHWRGRARWSQPKAGMFVWVELDREIDTEELLRRAVEEEGVAFIPGHAFLAKDHQQSDVVARRAMRLSFSTLPPDSLAAAVAKVDRCLD